nr:trna wybutosine-synthesizing protein 4 [Quercus suber]
MATAAPVQEHNGGTASNNHVLSTGMSIVEQAAAPNAPVGEHDKPTRDAFIMDTNNSSIVSKRSVEKLYYSRDPEYFRYFVSKFKRRSPLINRGYWLRMKAIEHTVTRFLAEKTAKRKVIINLGCG